MRSFDLNIAINIKFFVYKNHNKLLTPSVFSGTPHKTRLFLRDISEVLDLFLQHSHFLVFEKSIPQFHHIVVVSTILLSYFIVKGNVFPLTPGDVCYSVSRQIVL